MFVASPPVKFGTSARRVSAMLTMMEPEKTGPITAYTSSSIALVVSALAIAGLDCVSAFSSTILRPRMPPAALISFTASSTPFLNCVPAVVPVPESSTTLATFTVCCASAAPEQANIATASSEKRFMHSSW